MGRTSFLALLAIGAAIVAIAFLSRGKEGISIFFLGAVVCLCTLAGGLIQSVRVLRGHNAARATNVPALLAALVGIVLGGYLGVREGLGLLLIAALNPGLSEQDYAWTLGAAGGGLVGAFLLALSSGVLQRLLSRRSRHMGK